MLKTATQDKTDFDLNQLLSQAQNQQLALTKTQTRKSKWSLLRKKPPAYEPADLEYIIDQYHLEFEFNPQWVYKSSETQKTAQLKDKIARGQKLSFKQKLIDHAHCLSLSNFLAWIKISKVALASVALISIGLWLHDIIAGHYPLFSFSSLVVITFMSVALSSAGVISLPNSKRRVLTANGLMLRDCISMNYENLKASNSLLFEWLRLHAPYADYRTSKYLIEHDQYVPLVYIKQDKVHVEILQYQPARYAHYSGSHQYKIKSFKSQQFEVADFDPQQLEEFSQECFELEQTSEQKALELQAHRHALQAQGVMVAN